jgi:hypothetical protein
MKAKLTVKELLETMVFIAAWGLLISAGQGAWLPVRSLCWVVVLWAAIKFIYFLIENGMHIVHATTKDVPYHHFLVFMAYNIGQMSLSFALDFHALYLLDAGSLNGIGEGLIGAELWFEFVFYSVLNFSFFGFGDITPATVPAKLITLMEVVLALLTVIFILGDFISIREAVKKREPPL